MPIYMTEYTDDGSRLPDNASQPLPNDSVEAACQMFAGCRRVRSSPKLVIFDMGGRSRVAISDYAFK